MSNKNNALLELIQQLADMQNVDLTLTQEQKNKLASADMSQEEFIALLKTLGLRIAIVPEKEEVPNSVTLNID